MEQGLRIKQDVAGCVVRNGIVLPRRAVEGVQAPIIHDLRFRNPFAAMHYRNGRCIGVYEGLNDVTIVGKNYLWDVAFGAATPITQIDPWYIGLINQSPTPTLNENDTLASHSGWVEFTSYSGTRKAWDDLDSSNKVKGTNTVSQFDITGSGSVHGIFICEPTSGTTGVLWATGAFSSSIDVQNGDALKVTYGVRA